MSATIERLKEYLHRFSVTDNTTPWNISISEAVGQHKEAAQNDPDFPSGLPSLIKFSLGDQVLTCSTLELYAVTGTFFRGLLSDIYLTDDPPPTHPTSPLPAPVHQNPELPASTQHSHEPAHAHTTTPNGCSNVSGSPAAISSHDASMGKAAGMSKRPHSHSDPSPLYRARKQCCLMVELPQEQVTAGAMSLIQRLLTHSQASIEANLERVFELHNAAQWFGMKVVEDAAAARLVEVAQHRDTDLLLYLCVHSVLGLESVQEAAARHVCLSWSLMPDHQQLLLGTTASEKELGGLLACLAALPTTTPPWEALDLRNHAIRAAFQTVLHHPARDRLLRTLPCDLLCCQFGCNAQLLYYMQPISELVAWVGAMSLRAAWDTLSAQDRSFIKSHFESCHWRLLCKYRMGGDPQAVKEMLKDLYSWLLGPRGDLVTFSEVASRLELSNFAYEDCCELESWVNRELKAGKNEAGGAEAEAAGAVERRAGKEGEKAAEVKAEVIYGSLYSAMKGACEGLKEVIRTQNERIDKQRKHVAGVSRRVSAQIKEISGLNDTIAQMKQQQQEKEGRYKKQVTAQITSLTKLRQQVRELTRAAAERQENSGAGGNGSGSPT